MFFLELTVAVAVFVFVFVWHMLRDSPLLLDVQDGRLLKVHLPRIVGPSRFVPSW